jgi:hypothetical protein
MKTLSKCGVKDYVKGALNAMTGEKLLRVAGCGLFVICVLWITYNVGRLDAVELKVFDVDFQRQILHRFRTIEDRDKAFERYDQFLLEMSDQSLAEVEKYAFLSKLRNPVPAEYKPRYNEIRAGYLQRREQREETRAFVESLLTDEQKRQIRSAR